MFRDGACGVWGRVSRIRLSGFGWVLSKLSRALQDLSEGSYSGLSSSF